MTQADGATTHTETHTEEDQVTEEELKLPFEEDKGWIASHQMSTRSMARRLPLLVRRALTMAWRVDRWSVVILLACQATSACLGAFGLLAMTGTISALISSGHLTERLHTALPSLIVLVSATGLRALLGIAVNNVSSRLAPRIGREAELLLLDAAVNAELAAYDNPGYSDRRDAADRGAEMTKDLITESQDVMASVASLVSAACVVTVLHPALLPLLVLASLPQGIASVKAARITYLSAYEMSHDRRLLALLRWHMADKGVADEIRSGTMAPFLLERYRKTGKRIDDATDRAVHEGSRWAVVGAAVGGIASGLVWAALAGLLATGHMSVAHAGAAVFAVRNATSAVQGITSYGSRLFRTGMYLDDWMLFLDEAGGHRLMRGSRIARAPHLVKAENLTYTYPSTDRPALENINLEVRRGEIVALIGENGSGKTTLSRLLSALYLPTTGAVTWDGVDTRDLDPHAVWKQTAVVPQDFTRWPLSARENITLGQPIQDGDVTIARAAAESSADDVIAGLRNGLSTLLAREWWGGQELSGGQWQRIAIARAFHRPAGLLVLDEPTSALDPRAEHKIFSGLRTLARDRAVVLVTHRLLNVSIADRIVVLDRGRIIQQGTFTELVEAPGLFRDLWFLQNDRGNPIPAGGGV
jgi:ATP-binding cassette subfamily B protein